MEVFILQLEGSKKWKLYFPPEGQDLPKEYSPDFDQSEIGSPAYEPHLKQGDFMYFPRGTIHQAKAAEVCFDSRKGLLASFDLFHLPTDNLA